MFKNLILYRVTKDPMVLADFAAYAFEPCGAHQEKSIGWVPPRGQEFDADMAITTGELSKMIPALIAALGGEVV